MSYCYAEVDSFQHWFAPNTKRKPQPLRGRGQLTSTGERITMTYNEYKVGDLVVISDSKSTRDGQWGRVSRISAYAYWVRTADNVDAPVWSCSATPVGVPKDWFARMLATATDVFGSRAEAEAWLLRPAMGLNGASPVDMMHTQESRQHVDDFLGQLEHGVYI